jgi:hypothetical protein
MTLLGRNGGGTLTQTLEFVKIKFAGPGQSLAGLGRISALAGFVRPDKNMASWEHSTHLTALMGQVVVIDLKSTYVCLGTLVSCDDLFLELRDADLHDFRDSSATREVYVYDSARLGIRRNRARVLIRLDDVIALTRFTDIAES